MEESNDIRLSNDEYDSDAQAVQESELLPIYEAMEFSGDIQPLDDISKPDIVAVEFGTKKAENKNSDKKPTVKKKKIPSKRDSRIKTLVACLALILIVAGAMAGAYFGVERADKNDSPVAAVYNTTDKSTTVKLADGTDYDIGEAREVMVSTDGMYIWFSRNTSSATGKYDLRMIDVGSKKSLEKQGKFIEKGIDGGKVYLKRKFDLSKGSAEKLYKKASFIVFNEMIPYILEHSPKPKAQKGEAVVFKRRTSAQSELTSLKEPNLRQIYDFIRMLDAPSYPKAFICFDKFTLTLYKARLSKNKIKDRFIINEK